MSSIKSLGALLLTSAGLLACGQEDFLPVAKDMGGDRERGKVAMQQYACTGCHVIPGVVGANSLVGPPLDKMAKRIYIAGSMPNTPENMIKWLKDPQQIAPFSAMPNLDVTERDARDMAAYIYTLD